MTLEIHWINKSQNMSLEIYEIKKEKVYDFENILVKYKASYVTLEVRDV